MGREDVQTRDNPGDKFVRLFGVKLYRTVALFFFFSLHGSLIRRRLVAREKKE
jgi:hypothetical protein